MATALHHLTPEILFSRRAQQRHMARAAKAFSAISLGAAFAFTASEAAAQTARASTDNPFTAIDGTPLGFTEDGDLRVMLASGEEMIIPRGEYGLVGDQIMVSDLIDGVEVAQNGYIPPTSGAYPTYSSPGFFGGLGYGGILIPVGLVAAGIIAYIVITRSNNTAPELSEASYSTTFAENGTGTVLTVSATDAEKDTITYSLSGDDAGQFSIDASGKITFTDDPNHDAPGDKGFDNVYNMIVTATDDHGKASSSTVAVTVSSAADTATDDGDGTVDGTANNDDLNATAEITAASDLGAGNDFLDIQAGVATTIEVEMGTGNDSMMITTGGAIALDAVLDLGAGNDQLEIDVDTGANNFTIELGGGLNVIDIDDAQSAKQITVKDFSSDDVIDVSDWMTFTLDATAHASVTAARGSIGNDEYWIGYDSGTGHSYVFFNDGGVEVEMIIESYSGLTVADLIL